MNWKIFSIVCINLACIFFPYNIIGCAGSEPDPYDYWGNSWMLVQYDWSCGDRLNIRDELLPGDKEYLGVFRSEEYYLKAMALSNDQNFKARCLFMAAKCDQKQIAAPTQADYPVYSKPLFTTLTKEYSNTPFYKEAFNTCSYLKDFVKKMK